MKKKTKKSLLAVLGLLFCSSLAFGVACSSNSGGNKISVADGKREYVVNYGDWFDVPKATVPSDANVSYVVTDENGKNVAVYNNRFKPSIGTFTITYKVDGYQDVVVTIECKDEKAPSLSMESFLYSAAAGDVMDVPTFILEDPSGVNYDKTKISVFYGEQRTPVTIENGQYVVENAGVYSVEVYIEDMLGNSTTVVNEVKVTGAFIDAQLKSETLMDFDEEEYLNLIYPALGYDAVPMSIVTTDLPKNKDGTDSTGGMLKLSLEEDGETKLYFNGFKSIHAKNDLVNQIVFRYYSDELLARFSVYDASGQQQLLNRKYRMEGWWEFSFSPKSVVGWDSTFEDFYIHIECEDAANVYIDEVYYTKSWADSDIAENVVADFDEEGYLSLVQQNQFTVSAKYDVVQKDEVEDEDAKAGIHGGALKVELSENLAGYRVNFQELVDITQISSITIRMYMDRGFDNSRWVFIADNGEFSSQTWGNAVVSMAYHVGWWEYTFPAYHVQRMCSGTGSKYIAGFSFGYYETKDFSATLYVDEIRYQTKYTSDSFQGYNEEYDGKMLVDFADENYIKNVANIVALEKPEFSISQIDGKKMLAYTGVSSNNDNGIAIALEETVSLLDSKGGFAVGNVYIQVYYPESMKASIKFALEGNGSYVYSNTYIKVQEGYAVYGFAANDLVAKGIFDLRSVLAIMKSNNTCYITAVWYDSVIPTREAGMGSTVTVDGENCMLITDFATESHFARTLLPEYNQKATADAKKISFASGNGSLEYRLYNLSLVRGNARLGNEIVVEGTAESAIESLVVGVKLSNGQYVMQKAPVNAGNWSVAFYVEDLLDVGTALSAIVVAAEEEAEITLTRSYLTPVQDRLNTPTLSVDRNNGVVKVSWTAIDGASDYVVKINGVEVTENGTEIALSQSGLVTVQAVSANAKSLIASVYAETSYLAYNELMDGYTLVGFDTADSLNAIEQVATQAHNYTHAIAPSQFNWAAGFENEATSSPISAIEMNTTAKPWAQEGGWGGFSYAFPQAMAANKVGRIGVSVAYETSSDSRYSCHYFGIIADGKAYNLMTKEKSYVTMAKVGEGDVVYSETGPVDSNTYFADFIAMRAFFYLDVATFLQDHPEIEKIEGVYMGVYQSKTIYIDEIVYKPNVVAAPGIEVSHQNGVTTVTVTGSEQSTLKVLVNGVEKTVTGNTFTMNVSENCTIVAQNLSTTSGFEDSAITSKYVSMRFMQETDGKIIIEDFADEGSLSNVTNEVGIPYGRWEPMIKSTVTYTETVSNAYSSATGAMTVSTKARPWQEWAGATYYFPVGVSASAYGRLVLKITYPDWLNSQYGRQYVGLVIDGEYQALDLKKYVTGAKHQENNALGAEYSAENSIYFWDQVKGGTNCLGINIYIDLVKYFEDHPEILSIDGVFYGNAGDGNSLKICHIDEIWLEKIKLAQPTITYSRDQGGLKATITGDQRGKLRVNGSVVANPFVLKITQNTVIQAQSVSESEMMDSSNKLTNYVPASYLKNTDGTVVLDDFSGTYSVNKFTQLKKSTYDGTNYHTNGSIANSTFVHTSNDSADTVGKDDTVKVTTSAQAWDATCGWGGFGYTFLETLDLSKVAKITLKLQIDKTEEIFVFGSYFYLGYIVGGVHQGVDQQAYVKTAKVVGDTVGAFEVSANKAADPRALNDCDGLVLELDVAKLYEIGVTKLDGIYFGQYRTASYYVDEISYTLK